MRIVMSPENSQLYQRIQEFALDKNNEPLSFSKRLATENQWSLSYTKRVIEEYKKFTFLAVVAGHAVSPSVSVDKAWHLHLTYTRSYWEEFCPNVLGTPLHHEPSNGKLTEEVKFKGLYEQTLKSYESFLGEIPPSDIWTSVMVPSQQTKFKKIVDIFKKKIIQLVLMTLIVWILLGINWISDSPVYFNSRLFNHENSALAIPLSDYAYYWDFITVNIDAQADGSMIVEEVQKYTFNRPWTNKRHRFILLDKFDDIQDVSVSENGEKLETETSIKNQRFYIQWDHPLNVKDSPESHIFTLRYKVLGGLHKQGISGEDELYWKAIFPNRKYPILKAKVRVKLPEQLEHKMVTLESLGEPTRKKQIDPQTVEFVASNEISPGESIAIQGTFPHKILNLDSPKHKFSEHSSPAESFLLLIIILVFIFTIPAVLMGNKNPKNGGTNTNSNYSSCGGSCGSSCGGGCGGGD
ncbi:MAG: DUF2207 domain-containing protein [Crocosphaera sp.]|nr:DUF2207 domain-containing protein [Crocosphaera sp.]